MSENVWQDVFQEIFYKSLSLRGKDFDTDEMNEQFLAPDKYSVLKIGEVLLTSGRIEIGDPFCYMNSKYSCTLDKVIEPGSYPLYLSVMDHPVFAPKFLTAKLEVSKEVPVRYELAMPEGYSVEDRDKPGVMALFGVDAGLACICDKETSVAYDAFLKDWHQENPDKNHYDDYFMDIMKAYAETFPAYQREKGSYLDWKLPGTARNLLMFSSGFGDGAYSGYWGYDAMGEIACLVIPFINPEAYDVPMPEIPQAKKFCLKDTDIQQLIDSELFCIATDRIMVDGCKVGYMVRHTPPENRPEDSGWRFFEGTEDDAYMDDSDHLGVYKLNTVANYDRDIIPHLDAPAGIALFRAEDGRFYMDRGE